jgi:hypothetical protein
MRPAVFPLPEITSTGRVMAGGTIAAGGIGEAALSTIVTMTGFVKV